MKMIEYNGETYRPSQFWPLVRALRDNGILVRISCNEYRGVEIYARRANQVGEISFTRKFVDRSPFVALGKLVEEIKKAEEK